jgi:hypothetical protein
VCVCAGGGGTISWMTDSLRRIFFHRKKTDVLLNEYGNTILGTLRQVPSFCPASAMAAAGRRLRVTAGDFKALYGQGGPAARKFDCVVMRNAHALAHSPSRSQVGACGRTHIMMQCTLPSLVGKGGHTSSGACGVGSIPANSDAQNLPSIRRW